MFLPRYAKPTKSTRLYTYTNNDQDIIKQSFRAGNFSFLARLPTKIRPFGVSAAVRTHSKQNLTAKPRAVSVRRQEKGFEWMPDSYNRKGEALSRIRAESKAKQRTISRKEFVCSGTPDRISTREKNSKSAYVSINASFSSASDHASRLKWIRDVQVRHGQFRLGRSLDIKQSRSNASEIITVIRRRIAHDWQSTDFDIGLNASDCIEIRFHLASLESTEAMHYYMNVFFNKNAEISVFGLKKLQKKWGLKVGRFLVFELAPAWVKVAPGNALQMMMPRRSLGNPAEARKKRSGWSMPGTHISTRDSSISVRNTK
jgi:hypothetical protein